ncbi:N-acetylgalactosamine-6-phosphate deacetylase [Rhodovastum atsumiense]|uniref:N-acetylglucosamine-6-phosphate deacetylase n=1 Tax=Rhodovastum atsumiense TaxID=504468 RepID=A0A5M6IJX0_9PROT|nr:N-acetylglucosamine-6-phosphate deacetylase [Rhodovastum atsumiense]KAA5608550.1 N-acetylglucosamine-6-phosphate deacetylase [Rhodovastum atsumiense]CAH2599977.1 N-acetylgalactosamine-6-phosphate deacetylase [Rhodovastum atsumiense]
MTVIRAARLFDGQSLHEDCAVWLEDARIVAVRPGTEAPTNAERLPASLLLAPGFIDLQVNGGGGVLFNDQIDARALGRIAAAHAHAGSTAILPTLISGTRPQLQAALQAADDAMAQQVPGIVGLHLEGPFIAGTRRGIHPADAVTSLTDADVEMLCRPFPAPLLVTLAPETTTPARIHRLAQAGIIVFAGHTEATYEQVLAGLEAGISGFTHLYNAMSAFTSRAPGTVGAALDRATVPAGIIADGLHVHLASLRIAFAAKGPDALFLVSDAMPTAGSDCTGFSLGGERIHLHEGRLVNDAGTLAGAHLTLAEAVRVVVRDAGLPLEAALRMATATPARVARLADRGRIGAGHVADLVALDTGLAVTAVWQSGMRLR